MNIFKSIFWFTFLFFSYTISLFLFRGDHLWVSFVVLIATFISAYFYFINNKKSYLYGFLLTSGLPFVLFAGILLSGGIPHIYTYIIFIPILNFIGWCFAETNKKIYILIAALFISCASFVFLPNVINYANNKNPRTNELYPNISLIDKDEQVVKFAKNKIIILDFWTTSCGVCFKKFPDLEKVFLKYKNNPQIELYSVNVPLKRDSFEKIKELVGNLDYNFPALYAISEEKTEKEFNIKGYPHLVIIKNNKIRYEGFLNIDKNIFVYNTYNEIERLIDEP